MFRVMQLAQKQVPQPPLLGLSLEILDDGGDDLPPLYGIVRDLSVVKVFGRETFGLEEIDQVG